MADDLVAASWDDYEYLDSGDGWRLERFGPYVLRRPAQAAVWRPSQPSELWATAHATYERDRSGDGAWRSAAALPESWQVRRGALDLLVKPTPSGQVGLFPEQAPNWDWLAGLARARVAAGGPPLALLNLFAYTGATTAAAVAAGAQACHVDAVRGVVQWARENAAASGCAAAPVRWIVDDVAKFVKREARRGVRYDAVALDPPSFGRGSQGQVWKLERDLVPLLDVCFELLSDRAVAFLLTCHTPGISGPVLKNLLAPLAAARGGRLTAGEALLSGPRNAPPLPAGVWARWEPAAPAAATASPAARG